MLIREDEIEFVEGSKICARCFERKPLAGYHRQPSGPQGRHSWCKACANAYHRDTRVYRVTKEQKFRWNLSTKYGLTEDGYHHMLRAQRGACAICRTPDKRLVVDHCHATGAVRGLLCHRCNVRLAPVEDAEFMSAALTYLEKHKNKPKKDPRQLELPIAERINAVDTIGG